MSGVSKDNPSLIVVFGVTGDLANRKLLPALYNLIKENLLSDGTRIVGITRQDISVEELLKPFKKSLVNKAQSSPTAWRKFMDMFSLINTNLSEPESYHDLKKQLDRFPSHLQRIYYLSIPPSVQDEVISSMGKAGLYLAPYKGHRPRLLIEKPFGYDLKTAKELIKVTKTYFDEDQIYRIDHYLAKEMAQNILDIRSANPFFGRIWNSDHIYQVVITAHEKIGIEGRSNFYEQTGALRDVAQSHLLQLMALVAMEPPQRITSSTISRERLRLLKSVVAPSRLEKSWWRGQYSSYKKDTGLGSSLTETYIALRLFVDNKRWTGVPFILRAGKKTGVKNTDIKVYFGDSKDQNILTISLQPKEQIELDVKVKKPGHLHEQHWAKMDLAYERSFVGIKIPEAYERVLLDAINGQHILFASSSEILQAWRIVEPILQQETAPNAYSDNTVPKVF